MPQFFLFQIPTIGWAIASAFIFILPFIAIVVSIIAIAVAKSDYNDFKEIECFHHHYDRTNNLLVSFFDIIGDIENVLDSLKILLIVLFFLSITLLVYSFHIYKVETKMSVETIVKKGNYISLYEDIEEDVFGLKNITEYGDIKVKIAFERFKFNKLSDGLHRNFPYHGGTLLGFEFINIEDERKFLDRDLFKK